MLKSLYCLLFMAFIAIELNQYHCQPECGGNPKANRKCKVCKIRMPVKEIEWQRRKETEIDRGKEMEGDWNGCPCSWKLQLEVKSQSPLVIPAGDIISYAGASGFKAVRFKTPPFYPLFNQDQGAEGRGGEPGVCTHKVLLKLRARRRFCRHAL